MSRFILSSAMSTAARLPELLNRPFFDVMNMNESSIEASSSWLRAAVPSSWFAIMVNAKAARNRLKTSMMEQVSTESYLIVCACAQNSRLFQTLSLIIMMIETLVCWIIDVSWLLVQFSSSLVIMERFLAACKIENPDVAFRLDLRFSLLYHGT